MTIRPLHDRVVVKRLEAEEKTASGIVLPGALLKNPIWAKSSPWARAKSAKTARAVRWMSKPATKSSSANTAAKP